MQLEPRPCEHIIPVAPTRADAVQRCYHTSFMAGDSPEYSWRWLLFQYVHNTLHGFAMDVINLLQHKPIFEPRIILCNLSNLCFSTLIPNPNHEPAHLTRTNLKMRRIAPAMTLIRPKRISLRASCWLSESTIWPGLRMVAALISDGRSSRPCPFGSPYATVAHLRPFRLDMSALPPSLSSCFD